MKTRPTLFSLVIRGTPQLAVSSLAAFQNSFFSTPTVPFGLQGRKRVQAHANSTSVNPLRLSLTINSHLDLITNVQSDSLRTTDRSVQPNRRCPIEARDVPMSDTHISRCKQTFVCRSLALRGEVFTGGGENSIFELSHS